MKIKKNLLIVCEGQSTEPNYFHDLRNRLIENHIDFSVEIRPKPPEQLKEEKEALSGFRVRKGGKRRSLADVEVNDSDIIEDAYKAQPTRYVREAQLSIEDGTFDEAWAVYDFDGHPDHELAYNLANTAVNGKKVHIGFSSISFESWILWHFEENDQAFRKSQCRTGKSLHDCGQGTNPKDCNGAECITGYLKKNLHIPKNKNVKSIRFEEINDKVYVALRNSYEIREATISRNGNLPFYKINPITTVDRLVFKLLYIPIDYQWITINEIAIPNFSTRIIFSKNRINIDIKNTNNQTQIINADLISLVNVKGEVRPILERRVQYQNNEDSFIINLSDYEELAPVYISFKLNEDTFQILELPKFL